jgi:hypothetical protein
MSTRLRHSFCSLYETLFRPHVAPRTVAALIAVQTVLLVYSAYIHSPTLNEPAHLVAGLSNWKFGRFEVYKVNPPLVRMVAAIPITATGYHEDWSAFYEAPGARPEIPMGFTFASLNCQRLLFIFFLARLACIPFSWIGLTVCYLWARDLYGKPAGIVAALFWCFEPNILAHASLITPDAHGASLALAASYLFWRWLKAPDWTGAIAAGIVLGVAELSKTTFVLFYPLWPVMWLIYRGFDWHAGQVRNLIKECCMLLVSMFISLCVLNLGYGFEGSFTKLEQFRFVSDLFTASESVAVDDEAAVNRLSGNRFRGTCLQNVPVPFPSNYLLGIDLQQRDFEHYGRPSYLGGVWQSNGWWYYYLYAFAIKVPLGLWLVGLIVVSLRFSLAIKGRAARRDGLSRRFRIQAGVAADEAVLLSPPLLIFVVASAKYGLNEHLRYALCTLPYVIIACSQIALLFQDKNCDKSSRKSLTYGCELEYANSSAGDCDASSNIGLRKMLHLLPFLACLLIGWFVTSSLFVYPHSLSYFNELIGGPMNGSEHLLGSNLDWQQDFKYAGEWLCTKSSAAEVQVANPSFLNPYCLLRSVAGAQPFQSARVDDSAEKVSYLVLSESVFRKKWPVWKDEEGIEHPLGRDLMNALKEKAPAARFGYSMRVYELSIDAQVAH